VSGWHSAEHVELYSVVFVML